MSYFCILLRIGKDQERKYTYDVTFEECCSGKSISITQPECVFVTSGIQHAMRMRLIINCGLPRCTKLFPHYFIYGTNSETKVTENKTCVSVSQKLLFEIFSF